MQANLTPSSGAGLGLNDILNIIRNEEVYSKKIIELQRLIEEEGKAATKLTKSKNLDSALKRAKELELKAQSIVDTAEAKREKILEDVSAKSTAIIKQADEHAQERQGKVVKAKVILSQTNSKIETAKSELATIEKEIAEASGKAQQIIMKANAIKRDYEGKLKDLKERLRGI